jgi:hypothetical protein
MILRRQFLPVLFHGFIDFRLNFLRFFKSQVLHHLGDPFPQLSLEFANAWVNHRGGWDVRIGCENLVFQPVFTSFCFCGSTKSRPVATDWLQPHGIGPKQRESKLTGEGDLSKT